MFYYEEKNNKYYIWTDKIKWKFWPFSWIYIKNKILWDFPSKFNTKDYPAYKYSIWIWENKIFVISLLGIQKLI